MSHLRKAWYLRTLLRQQWLPQRELEELQQHMLRRILQHAYRNVPFYHRKFRAAGLLPDDIKTTEDLVKIPCTTKKEIKENYPADILAQGVDISRCWTPQTSGSTGISLKIAYDRQAEDWEKANALRPNISCGQGIFDTWVAIVTPVRKARPKQWFQKFRLFNPTFLSSTDSMQDHIRMLEQVQPRILDGYASAIYVIAKEVLHSGITTIHPEIVFTTADLLTEEMRRTIEQAFGAEVYDQFGCVELARTAWECPEHSGYHIDIDSVVMEFLRDGEQAASGERGEICYTGLYNYAMPLIRYTVGDVGIPTDKKCPCGRGLPLMKSLEGRLNTFIQNPKGQIFSQMIFFGIIKKYTTTDQIAGFKVIQEDSGHLQVLIMRGSRYSPDTIVHLEEEIGVVFGSDLKVSIEQVSSIPREPSGKMLAVVSKIPADWSRI